MTRFTKKPTHFTLPAILPAILTGLFILTACGGSALTNDAKIATNTQKNACKTNPLADGCQAAGAGFLSVGLDEGIGNQEAESSEAPTSPSTQSSPAGQPTGTTETSPKFEPAVSAQVSVPARITAAAADAALDATRGVLDDKDTADTSDDTNNQQNQFLQSGATELDKGDEPRIDSLRMNLAQARYDGAAIGGHLADGIDFFTLFHRTVPIDNSGLSTGDTTTTRYHYAGILSGTDLGAPVSSDVGMATWNGSFRTHNTNPVDFQLAVGFGGDNPSRTISAFVKDGSRRGDYYYLLDGTYNEAGLITGTVNWGEFTGGAQNAPVGGNNGILRGLIGVEGAVGTFVSGSAVHATNGKVTDGVNAPRAGDFTWGLEGYVGGFVASATFTDNPDVTFSDWTRAIPTVTGGNNGFEAGEAYGLGQTAIPDVISRADCEVRNRLFSSTDPVTGNVTEFNQTDCDLTDSGSLNLAGTRFREVTQSGVAFVTEGISLTTLTSGKSFAGLLSGTDLGAPITDANQVGEWKGQFKSVGGYYFGASPSDNTRVETAVDTDFTLTVTFGGGTGTLSAFVPIDEAGRHFYLTGTFDANGIITGDVRAANFTIGGIITKPATTVADDANGNGVLTGLIGVEGAVGAFVSNADNYNYAGGFVANAIPPDTEREVTFGDWTRSFATAPATAPTTPLQSEFLQATGGTLPSGIQNVSTLNLNTADFRNNQLGGDANDGVAFSYSSGSPDYAGIFDTTDLGAPISSQEASAQWHGQFQVLGALPVDTDFRLEITFGGEDNATGSIEAFVLQASSTYYYLEGTFSNTGVIKGTNTFGTFTDGDRNAPTGNLVVGVLTGLIGEDGAVGAFHSTQGLYAGGFVAQPTVFVTYDTWLGSSFETLLLSEADNSLNPINQFVQGGADMIDAGNVKVGNAPVTPVTLKIPNSNSGVSFLQGDRGGYAFRTVFSAGILSGTNVGLPLDLGETFNGDASATWNGEIQWVGALDNDGNTSTPGVALAGSGADARAFGLDVNFTANTIEAFVPMGDNSHHLLLEAGYNAKGQFTNGTVKYGIFAGGVKEGERTASGTDDRVFGGTLTGIIGQEGAVGAFISERVPNSSIDFGFAGGFWAAPTQ